MRKRIPLILAATIFATVTPLGGCAKNGFGQRSDNVLRVASWDEYIDMADYDWEDEDDLAFRDWLLETSGIDLKDSSPIYEEFEDWYFEQTGERITVEYVALQDNETMYNKIKMGDTYDLLCPSEYMMMKLAQENRLDKYPESFFDSSVETNYYAQNVSPYIKSVFENGKNSDGSSWAEYIAGYMWGTTGFVFNPENIDAEKMQSWNCLTDEDLKREITAKDNVRDSYFMGLGLYYEDALAALKENLNNGEITKEAYQTTISEMMNDTSVDTMNKVKKLLEKVRKNLYGLETDEAKSDMQAGRLNASYQWSGDAVYILDEVESDEENSLMLEYCIPETASNLWFDGWVMTKGMSEKKKNAALAFVNYLSRPDNVQRNMYYIGYTSCIGGEEVFGYIDETYSATEEDEQTTTYDLRYFFGDDESYILTVPEEQTRRQLFAQYPTVSTIDHLVVMKYFDKETNERANRMWNNIK